MTTTIVHTSSGSYDATPRSPASGSAAVGVSGGEVGTLGCLVRLNGKTFILGSGHVMIPSSTNRNPGQLYQPPASQKGHRPIAARSPTAAVFKDGATYNTLDAAVAEVLDRSQVSARIGDLDYPVGFNRNIAVGARVRIHGAGGMMPRSGTVESVGVPARVDYGSNQFGLFDNVVQCSPGYSQPGDSGAAVMDDDRYIVGVHLGAVGAASLFCPISAVLARWPGIELITHDN